jgi:hypothetical protein
MYLNFFFLNRYPVKIIEIFGTNFVTRLWGLFASPMLIREEEKINARKLSLVFLLTYTQRLTAAPVTVTYNDKGGRWKRKKRIIW